MQQTLSNMKRNIPEKWLSLFLRNFLCNKRCVLDRSSELGAKEVSNSLKALLAVFVLRFLNSNTTARQLVTTITASDSGQEWVVYVGNRGNLIAATTVPSICELLTLVRQFAGLILSSKATVIGVKRVITAHQQARPFHNSGQRLVAMHPYQIVFVVKMLGALISRTFPFVIEFLCLGDTRNSRSVPIAAISTHRHQKPDGVGTPLLLCVGM
ncbi:hypothetical protein niasHS_000687 [Heterodera schachtii]|uniref:Uncharacterized protein n=1 Tax=Heterodera schachtii TaxID=97005 RepID=A0ABD2K4Z0_HETSC